MTQSDRGAEKNVAVPSIRSTDGAPQRAASTAANRSTLPTRERYGTDAGAATPAYADTSVVDRRLRLPIAMNGLSIASHVIVESAVVSAIATQPARVGEAGMWLLTSFSTGR